MARYRILSLDGGGMSLRNALALFGLGSLSQLPAGLLSAGQKRKLALSRLLAAPRPIWLLDEPSVSLDTASVKVLERLIADCTALGYRQMLAVIGDSGNAGSIGLHAACGFAYRHSALPKDEIVVAATLELVPRPRAEMDATVRALRRELA